jgi:hypothetical protein
VLQLDRAQWAIFKKAPMIGAQAVLVHAISDEARAFYADCGSNA